MNMGLQISRGVRTLTFAVIGLSLLTLATNAVTIGIMVKNKVRAN